MTYNDIMIISSKNQNETLELTWKKNKNLHQYKLKKT